jgi:hypothetical protein
MARPKSPTKTSTGPASRELLGEIHQALAERLLENVRQPDVNAAMLSAARAFLADNAINAATLGKTTMGDALGAVAGSRLPLNDDANVYFLPSTPRTTLPEREGVRSPAYDGDPKVS